jgi:Ca2+-binding RTX toxin-like protein
MGTIFGTNNGETLNGTADGDTIIARGGSDTITGGDGNDVIVVERLPVGSDTIDGGAGLDVVSVQGAVADYTLSFAGAELLLTHAGDGTTSHLTGVEKIGFDDGNVLIVGAGGFASIQDAVDAAADGDTILVAEGTYIEQVVVNGLDNLTIRAADGADVTIEAPADVTQTTTSSSGRAVNAVVTVLNGSNVVIEGITVDGHGAGNTVDGANANFLGVYFRNASGGLTDVDIVGVRDAYPGGTTADGFEVQSGNQRGVALQVDNDAPSGSDPLLQFFMHGGSISDFQKNATSFLRADLDIDGVHITGGGGQTINAQNGIQAVASTGSITNNIIDAIGYAGPSNTVATGILLFSNTDLDVTGNAVTGSSAPGADSVGIYVTESGGPSSGGEISGNTISHVDQGIFVGGTFAPGAITVGANDISDIDTTTSWAAGLDFEPDPDSAAGFIVAGGGSDDYLAGAGQDDALAGLGGNDTLVGNGGDDHLDGGFGTDTAVYTGNIDAYTVSTHLDDDGFADAFTDIVGGTDGSDTLTGVELVQFADRTLDLDDPIQLFSGGELVGTFDTIQAAIDAASGGETILVSAGNYDAFTVNKQGLTITGIGAVTIEGDFRSANPVPDGVTVGEWLQTATGYSGGGVGATIAADGVTLSNLSFTGLLHGVSIGGSDNLTLNGVHISDSVYGIVKFGDTDATGFQMLGGSITDSYQGFTIDSGGGTNAAFDGVLLDGVTFADLTEKGFYADNLSNAQLLNLIMTNVGEFGRGPAFGAAGTGEYGAGIDLNLKFGDYENIEIAGFDFTDVGSSSAPDTIPLDFGVAIGIKARDDGGYSGNPATLDGVSIHDGTIDGTSTGIRIGEPGTNQAGPSNVVIEDVTITDASVSEIDNTSQASVTVIGGDGNDSFSAGATSDGAFTFSGGGGDDSFTGGAGIDTVTVTGDYDLTANGTDWTVTSDDGADALSGIEIVTNGASRTLLVGSGGFATIQEAVDAAHDGDTILIAAGTYSEQVLVQNKDLTIEAMDGAVLEMPDQADIVSSGGYNSALTVIGGAVDVVNLDIDGRGQGGPFATQTFAGVAFIDADGSSFVDGHITGFHAPPAQAGNQHGYGIIVRSIDGNPDAVEIAGSIIDGFQKNGIDARGTGLTVDIHDNVITGAGATGTPAQNGVVILNAGGVVDHNTITALGYTGTDTIATGVLVYQSDGVAVTDNTVTMAGTDTQSTAIHLFNSEPGTITGNAVDEAQTGIEQTGSFTDPADVGGNTFGDLGANYSFDPDDGETTGFDAGGTGGDDVLDGSAAGDVLDGGAGDDTLGGQDGDDTLIGGTGTDHLDGGAGEDTAVYDAPLASSDFAVDSGHWVVGGDSLSGVEVIDDGVGGNVLLVGAGGFATIQEAVDAANPGDTILVAPGTYNENVLIDKDDLTLVSLGGRGATTIQGDQGGAGLGTIQLAPGVDGVTIGGANAGFTIIGINGNGAIEKAGIYLQGTHDGITIVGNEVVAAGDEALVSEYNQAITNILIDGNEFSGQSFDGAYVSPFGTDQFGAGNNVPRGLVVLGGGSNLGTGNPSHHVVFTNNVVSGTAGGETGPGTGLFNGNTLVTIDASHSTVEGNDISGDTANGAYGIRTRGAGTDVSDNDLSGHSGGIFVNNQGTPGDYSGNAFSGTGGDDVVTTFTPGNDEVSGGDGNDVLAGGLGDDAIDGGNGIDTVGVSGTPDFAIVGGKWTVTSDHGTDTLTDVEIVSNGSARTLLVGAGGFDTIQAAVDAAQPGDTILVAPGTYNENVTISTNGLTLVSLDGSGATTIVGTNGLSLGTVQLTPGVNDVTIGGDGQGFTIVGLDGPPGIENGAVYLQGAHDGLLIEGNDIVANGDAGLMSEFGPLITDTIIRGNTFSGQTFVGTHPAGEGFASQFTLANVPRQLVVIATGSNVTFEGNHVTGTAGGISADTGNPQGNTLVTIDTANSLIQDNDFSGYTTGSGYGLRARGSGTDIVDNDLSGHNGGIFINNQGTPGDYSGNGYSGTNGIDLVTTFTPGSDHVSGGDGDDVLTGGLGDDVLDGGAGTDTAVYAGSMASYTIGYATDSNGHVTGFTSVTGGTDGDSSLISIEKLVFLGASTVALDLSHPVQLFAGSTLIGTFDTIQAAVNAATAGQTIIVPAGTWSENVNVDKDVTILGANSGISGGGARGAEAVIDGIVTIGAAGATLDGFTVTGAPLFGQGHTAVYVSADNVTLSNLVIEGPGGGSQVYGVVTTYGGGVTGLLLSGNLVTGWEGGTYFNPSTGFIATGNTFDGNGSGIVGDDWAPGTLILGNTFLHSDGAHVGYGSLDSLEDVAQYLGVGNSFGAGGFAVGITAYGESQTLVGTNYADTFGVSAWALDPAAGALLMGLGGDDSLAGGDGDDTLLGGVGGDTLIGGAGEDVLKGEDGDDALDGGVGNDTLLGGIGNDTLLGGAGNDLASGGIGDDTIDGGAGDDVIDGGAGNDRLFGRDGNNALSGGDGLDVLHGFGGNDVLDGGLGNDRLFGRAGSDLLNGGDGNDLLDAGTGAGDTMAGGAGDDVYYVHAEGAVVIEAANGGADVVRAGVDYVLTDNVEELFISGAAREGTGNALDNVLHGSSSSNTLLGLAGDDVIRGVAGRDTIDGGAGEDLIDGGAGKDTMTGGADRDVFQFRDGDFGATRALADVITDFSHNDAERIQLNLVDANVNQGGDQAFAWIGSGAFTGVAGQLHYALSGGNTYVEGDTNGDGTADFVIALTGTINLVASDFIL